MMNSSNGDSMRVRSASSVRAVHADNGTIVADLDTDTSGNREVTVESVQ
jgi:hypothetical protein